VSPNAAERLTDARWSRPGDYPGRSTPAPAASGPGVQAIRVADVEAEHVSWLWPGYLPAGKLCLLDGDPGAGKSTMTLDVAARVSTGSPMPDGAPCGRPGHVLLLSAEDGIGDTIRPRLEAAGADLTRVSVLTELLDDEQRGRPLDLSTDLAGIRPHINRVGASLVVVDPLMAFLGTGVDSHRDQDIRRALHPLANLADQTGATVLIVRHLNKSSAGSALYRGGGSIGIIGAARAAFVVATDPDDAERRVLAPTKSNLAMQPPSLLYRLVSDPDRACGRIVWEGVSVRHADELLSSGEQQGEQTEAATFLRELLEVEPLPAKVVLARARDAGVAERTLKRAKAHLGVDSIKTGFGEDARWLWKLPDEESRHAAKGAKDANSKSWPPSALAGTLRVLRPDQEPTPDAEPPPPGLSGDVHEGLPVLIGQCALCGGPCERYGPTGRPTCLTCHRGTS